ncbi:MAG: hypothetical protein LBK46_07135 [Oscillospiraceae bacterium]|jgi:hypothetical protein|nr:hypothetical protein [Oscillospiraceae bacterium]
MEKICLVWGRQQEALYWFGTAGESLSSELIIDVSRAERRIPGAVYSIHARRSDGWTYPAAVGLRADSDLEIRYVLEETDLAVSGALRMTVRADASGGESSDGTSESGGTSASSDEMGGTGERRAQWSVIGWVSPGSYEGAEPPKPDWVSAVLAFANAFGGISARIALLPPNARPAAAFVQEPDGMKLVLSLPDTSGIGDGGHAIFDAPDETGLTALTEASIGDQAITADGDVYMCVGGYPSQESAWVRLTQDVAALEQLEEIAEQIDSRVNELNESIDSLEQALLDITDGLSAMEQTVSEISQTVEQVQQADGILKSSQMVVTAAELGVDYAAPPVVSIVAIDPEEWVDGAADVISEDVHVNSTGLLCLAPGASAEEYAIYAAAQPRVSAQWDGGMTITISGDTPEEPLPLQILILS